MKILADYHTHTVYSDGKGTMEENIRVAILRGIKTIGICDHSYKHLTYGLKKEEIPRMRHEVDILNEKFPEIEILLGLECNILDDKGNLDVDEEDLKYLDYYMAGYHFASKPQSFKGLRNHIANFFLSDDKTKTYNTNAIVNAMKNNDIFCITHPGDKGDVFIEEIAKVALSTDTRLEINGRHNFLNIEQLREIEPLNNKFLIGSDAHRPQNVGKFDLALSTAINSNMDLDKIENIKF